MFKTTLKGYRRRQFFFFLYIVHLNPSIYRVHHVFSPSHIFGPAIRRLLIVISSPTFFFVLYFFMVFFDLLFGDTNVFLHLYPQNNSYSQDRNEYLPTIISLPSLKRCPKCNRLLFINFIYLINT